MSGWFGRVGQVMHFLRTVGADQDAEGKFLIEGVVSAFLGDWSDGSDCVVGEHARYFVGGKPASLALGLSGTSYGMNVEVIGE